MTYIGSRINNLPSGLGENYLIGASIRSKTDGLDIVMEILSDTLRCISKNAELALKNTSIWKKMNTRRIHVYGVGAPRTGTLSLSKMFTPKYKSDHEPNYQNIIPIVAQKHGVKKRYTRRRIKEELNRERLEVHVSHILVYVLEEIKNEFSNCKFICTYRKPKRWITSMLNRRIKYPLKNMTKQHPGRMWKIWRRISLGVPYKESKKLPKNKLHSARKYLKYWSWHYRSVINKIPKERLLVIKTDNLSKSRKEVSKFLGIEKKELSKPKKNHETKNKIKLKSVFDEEKVEEKIEKYCKSTIEKMEKRVRT